MRILENIEPKNVFRFFEDICAIPHGSGNTKQISDFCVEFAKARGLRFHQDDANNVIIWKDGMNGGENAEPVILQGHLDMVCQKEDGVEFDFMTDGLKLMIDGDYVTARGTTLGGDDGAAVAIMLALLDADDLTTPPIEAVFTTDEEIGMLGAAELDFSLLKGRKMINLDSEAEDEFVAGCAGGVRASVELPLKFEKTEGTLCRLTVGGLKGGHSGLEAGSGAANATKLMGRVLNEAAKSAELRLADMVGGSRDNVIPSKTVADVVVNDADVEKLAESAGGMENLLKNEFAAADPNITVACEVLEKGSFDAADRESTDKAISALMLMPNGMQAMSMEIPGLVQTSLNLGIMSVEDGILKMSSSVRSSKSSQKEMLVEEIGRVAKVLGATMTTHGDYPAWEYRAESPFREMMLRLRREVFGSDARVSVIHAGLECGLFSDALEGLDCVSIGPDIHDIHDPRERLGISSMQRLWAYVVRVLAEMAK